ncbi:MAG: spermidine/putrescine ABC transporter substrate-binding protein, partial [Lachnospiraceae bacterium]|nr:spermidine/putrescine ABC transporter substrate-binding protein [Lachnospiraceae bacterium]
FAITKHCENTEYAAKFLDFLCREDVAKVNFEYIYFSTPNTKVIEGLSDEEKEDPTLVPPESSIENCEVCTQTDKKVTDLMNELWKELKSK